MEGARISGSVAFLELLAQEGVDLIFGNPGTTELPLMDALAADRRFRYVLCLHEGVAMAMADGYAQASGRPAVVSVHASPGLGNAMGMLYNAFESGAPIVVTAGQHDQSFTAMEPVVWSDLPTVARPYVKWSTEVRRPADLARIVHRAFKFALTPPTGPVFVSLPVDVMTAVCEFELDAPSRVDANVCASRAMIDRACELLAAATNPLIVAGDAVAQSDALRALVELAETLGAPVRGEGMSNRCNFPFVHPLWAGHLPRLAPGLRQLCAQHDLVFAIGADLFTLSLPSEVSPIPPGFPIIHLDVDPWEIGKNHPTQVAMIGDPTATLGELTAALRERLDGGAHAAASARVRAAQAERVRRAAALRAGSNDGIDRVPIPPDALLHAFVDCLPADSIVVDESLSSGEGLLELLPCQDRGGFFGLRGGGVGWGLGAALGVKLASPARTTFALVGDGSAMYANQALWTAAHYHIAVVFIIVNNVSYRMLKQRTRLLGGNAARDGVYVAMDLDRPEIDFVALARAQGVPGERVDRAADLGAAVARALTEPGPYLIDARVDGRL